ncbi:hypothetical protein ACI2K4_14140 [Micromonospora sp. NPDC050397]|uniref:hypothetical protein n=1 Tax=Micromonospora sp. NPDC050397 TaxID=3364279 RepID=UPI00384CEF34
MESLRELANRLDEAAATLAAAGPALTAAGRTEPSPGEAGTGRLTEVTRALFEQWSAAATARAQEAATGADRLADLAATLRQVADGYADTDDAARRRHAEEA